MTRKKLEKMLWLGRSIVVLQNQIDSASEVRASPPSVLRSIGAKSDPTSKLATKLAELKDVQRRKTIRYAEMLVEFEVFVESLDNEDDVLILRRRFVEGKTLEKIGYEIYLHRTSVSRRIARICRR